MKENLLRAKRLLERKCFVSDDESEYKVEPYLEVVKSLYFDFRYVDTYPYPAENQVKLIKDILRVYVNDVGCKNNENRLAVASYDISTYQKFVITFEDILEDYRSYKSTVCKISKSKNKIKILTKE